jgi:hypothetical protein
MLVKALEVHCAAATLWNSSRTLGCGERKRRIKKNERNGKKKGREIEKMNYPFLRNCDL